MKDNAKDRTNKEEKAMLKVFGTNIKKIRLRLNLTQEKLGELSRINYKYIGEIERGEKNPTALIIYKLSQALNVSVSEIMADITCRSENSVMDIERMFEGKDMKAIRKAMRILEILFE